MRFPRPAHPARGSPAHSLPANRGRFASLRLPVAAALLATLVTLGLGLAFGLRALAGDRSTATASLPSFLEAAGPLVVFSEFGETADTLWAADPDDPSQRIELARLEHARWFGVFPSLSPKGAFVAYTALPPNLPQPDPDVPAELWVLEVATGEAQRLATDVDLLIRPVWSPTGDAVVVRRSERQEDGGGELLRIDLDGGEAPLATTAAALFPIDFSPDGAWLYYAVLSPSGTDLARAPALGGASEPVARLTNGFSRDWRLSPDGRRLAYLAEAPPDAGTPFVAQVLDLSTGQVEEPLAGARAAQFSPVWERSGALTIGRLSEAGDTPVRFRFDGQGEAAAVALPPPRDARRGGFDAPLSWSPGGAHLAVRRFEGASLADPGPSRVVVATAAGERRELSDQSDVMVLGWLEAAP